MGYFLAIALSLLLSPPTFASKWPFDSCPGFFAKLNASYETPGRYFQMERGYVAPPEPTLGPVPEWVVQSARERFGGKEFNIRPLGGNAYVLRAKILKGEYDYYFFPENPGSTSRDKWFARTGRTLAELREHNYPAQWLDPKTLVGKKVLDAGSGIGQMVEELRSAGVNAMGLDTHLTQEQLKKGYYLHASMTETHLASNQFDVVFSTWSLPSYAGPDKTVVKSALVELLRITKPGGVIRINPLNIGVAREVAHEIPGLQLRHIVDTTNGYAVEFRKKR